MVVSDRSGSMASVLGLMLCMFLSLCNLCFQMGYLCKEPDGSLLYTVVNQLDPDAEGLLSLCSLLNVFHNPVFMHHLLLHFYHI